MENRIVWILLGGTMLTGVVLLVVLAFIDQPLEHGAQNKQRFDSKIWMSYADSDDRDNLRGTMVNDLRNRLVRERPDRESLIKLLGEPDYEKSDEKYSYRLGMWSNNRQTRDVLEIYFQNDIVSDIQFAPEQ